MKRLIKGVAAVVVGLAAAGPVGAEQNGVRARQTGATGGSTYTVSDRGRHNGVSTRTGTVNYNRVNPTYFGPGTNRTIQGSFRPYYVTYATPFKFGYFYPGFNHNHWQSRTWSDRYRCFMYFDPGLNCSFYWCGPDNCFYPVTYCPYGRYNFALPR
jgi:hypothetical protein